MIFTVLNPHFQNSENPKTYHAWLLRNSGSLLDLKGPGPGPLWSQSYKMTTKIIAHGYIY